MLQAAGFPYSEHALDKQTAMVGLGSMGSPTPDDWMAQDSFGSVVRRFDAQRRRKMPQSSIQGQQVPAGLQCAGTVTQKALREPKPDMTLDGQEFGLEGSIRQGTVAHPRPEDQQVFGLKSQVGADAVEFPAAFQDP